MSEQTEEQTEVVPRMTEEEITDLARRSIKGEIFVTWEDQHWKAFELLFMLSSGPTDWAKDVGLCWAPMSAASARSINGVPIFFTVLFVHRLDVIPFKREVLRMGEAIGDREPGTVDAFDALMAKWEAEAAAKAAEGED